MELTIRGAGMTCKTLTLAAQQAFKQLEVMLGEPCPGLCGRALDRPERCCWSWGHAELPAELVTDPGSLKVLVTRPF